MCPGWACQPIRPDIASRSIKGSSLEDFVRLSSLLTETFLFQPHNKALTVPQTTARGAPMFLSFGLYFVPLL